MTINNPFAQPAAPSGGITWGDLLGALIIIQPTRVETGIHTDYGETDAIAVNAWVIDGPGKGETYEDALVFPKVLQSQLKSRIGQIVIGRVGQGVAKRAGQNPPWQLSDASDADIQLGAQVWARIQAKTGPQNITQQQAATPPPAQTLPTAQPTQNMQFDDGLPF